GNMVKYAQIAFSECVSAFFPRTNNVIPFPCDFCANPIPRTSLGFTAATASSAAETPGCCQPSIPPRGLAACARSAGLCAGHFLGHVKYQLAIAFFSLAQQTPKLAQIACIFARTTPGDVVRQLPLWKI